MADSLKWCHYRSTLDPYQTGVVMRKVTKKTQLKKELSDWLEAYSEKTGDSQSAILSQALREMRERKGRPAFAQEQA
jgi:hypothetical protein